MTRQARRNTGRTVFGMDGRMMCGDAGSFGGRGGLPAPFSREEEYEVLLRANDGDAEARNRLIERNLRLVVYIARKFENTGFLIEDLISIGVIGLIKAINSFDIGKQTRLATYASHCIRNEILMALRGSKRLRMESSLDEPLHIDQEGNELLLSDVLGTEGDSLSRELDAAAERQMLYGAMGCLDSREMKIIALRFGLHDSHGHTQKEVANMMGMSQSYISRLEQRIIKQLRTEMLKAM